MHEVPSDLVHWDPEEKQVSRAALAKRSNIVQTRVI